MKIGLVTTLSGPAGVIGKHMKDAADLALEMLGGKIGGKPAVIVYGDDQFKPDVGRQVAEEMLKRDKRRFHDRLHLVECAAGVVPADDQIGHHLCRRQCRTA